jgi:hypothetical protein
LHATGQKSHTERCWFSIHQCIYADNWFAFPVAFAVFSVLQSGFEQQFKVHFLGNNYWKRSLQGNDIRQTNLPDVRIQFRAELLGDELRTLHHHTKLVFDDSLIDRIM